MSKTAFPVCVADLYLACSAAVSWTTQESLQNLAEKVREFERGMPEDYWNNGAASSVSGEPVSGTSRKTIDVQSISAECLDLAQYGTFTEQAESYYEEVGKCESLSTRFLTESGIREACPNEKTYQVVRLLTMQCFVGLHAANKTDSILDELRIMRRLFSEKLKAEQR